MSIATIMSSSATAIGSQFYDGNYVSGIDCQGWHLHTRTDVGVAYAKFQLYYNNVGSALSVAISPHTLGTVVMVIGRFNGASSSIHARTDNGSIVSTSGSLTNLIQVSEANRLIIVGRNVSGESNSAVHFAANWNRALTDSEISRLMTKGEIFGLYKNKKQVIYSFGSSFPVLTSLAVSNITSSGGRLTASA
jgi:hypothetical protein